MSRKYIPEHSLTTKFLFRFQAGSIEFIHQIVSVLRALGLRPEGVRSQRPRRLILREALMRRVPHSWREAYELALKESDPVKAIGRIEYAMYTLERRYSEWGTDPGTPAELAAIQTCIAALARLMEQNRRGSMALSLQQQKEARRGAKQDLSEKRGKAADYPKSSVGPLPLGREI